MDMERESARRKREIQRELDQEAKHNQRELLAHLREESRRREAMLLAEESQNQIIQLETVHRQSFDPTDWESLRDGSPPSRPEIPVPHELVLAEEALRNFRPTLLERILKRWGSERRALLEQERTTLYQAYQAAIDAADQEFQQQLAAYYSVKEIAQGVLDKNSEACETAAYMCGCYDELIELGCNPLMSMDEGDSAYLMLTADESSGVPKNVKIFSEETNRVYTEKLSAARRMEIHQDYVCGVALRGARETFAAIPHIKMVLVDVVGQFVDKRTGEDTASIILSVYCPRSVLQQLNWDEADASDEIEELEHRMNYNTRRGMQPVVSFADDEGGQDG